MNKINSSEVHESIPIISTETGDQNSDNTSRTRYYKYGEQAAQHTKFDPRALGASLDHIYQTFLTEQQLDEEGIRNSVKRLQSETAQKQALKHQAKFELENKSHSKDAQARRVEELEVERVKISQQQPQLDYVPFAIGTLIVVLLTLYLIVFYSSTGYAAFYGIKPGSLGFINPNVFRDAIQKGAGVIAMIILFPVIFLGLGFLIHDSLEKKKYVIIGLLLLFTLITDGIIGYKISEAVHNNNFNAGLTNEQWRIGLILSDLNFYLVLALGFIVYIIWGVLLNYVLNKFKELQPDKALEIQLKNHDRKTEEERKEYAELGAHINSIKANIKMLEFEISQNEQDIIGYQNGVIPVNVTQLKAALGDFVNGWIAFTQNEINKLCVEARLTKDVWLESKIKDLAKR